MIIEIVSVTAPTKKRDEFGKAMASLVGPIQVQRGCLSCLLSQTWPMGDEMHIEARWDIEESLTAHLQSDICKKLLPLVELSAAPPALEFFSVIGFRGLDLVERARTSPE